MSRQEKSMRGSAAKYCGVDEKDIVIMTFHIPRKLRQKIRIKAAREDITIRNLLIDIISDSVKGVRP